MKTLREDLNSKLADIERNWLRIPLVTIFLLVVFIVYFFKFLIDIYHIAIEHFLDLWDDVWYDFIKPLYRGPRKFDNVNWEELNERK